MKVVIIGAGYVGLTLGVVAASSGHSVHFVEIDQRKLNALLGGSSHFYEPGIDLMLQTNLANGRISASNSLSTPSSLSNDEPVVYVITMGTPLSSFNQRSADHPIVKLIHNDLVGVLRDIDVICLRSTVEIGFCDFLTRSLGCKINLAFCPERTVEGKALIELNELPQIIATTSDYAYNVCMSLFCFAPSFIRLEQFASGEAVKLVCNTYRDWNFAFSNLCGLVALEHSIDVSQVLNAANFSYPRSAVPSPGLVGGPCLEKDPFIFSRNLPDDLSQLVKISRIINDLYFRTLLARFIPAGNAPSYAQNSVVILGASFKGNPPTDDTRGSFVHPTLTYLREVGFKDESIVVFDPLVKEIIGEPNIRLMGDPEELVCSDADFYILLTNHTCFYSDRFYRFFLEKRSKLKSFWPALSP